MSKVSQFKSKIFRLNNNDLQAHKTQRNSNTQSFQSFNPHKNEVGSTRNGELA
jgi:hypothetical protein